MGRRGEESGAIRATILIEQVVMGIQSSVLQLSYQ